ncbi:MAG: S8 family serine peptidase [Anaerolineales bacterium]|nr:S8 family serine peptidase [Anaerolineales bacterium]
MPRRSSGISCPDSGTNCALTIGGCDHGTHVAGIAAGNNNGGNIGVARDATLIAIQVFSRFDDDLLSGGPTPCADAGTASPCALSYTSDQIKALERVFELRQSFNIAAVNMSLGGGQFFAPCDNEPIKAAIDNLRAAGIATVIAAGNSGFTNSISAPGCVSSAISVGATDDADNVAVFSNIASFVSLLAPGVNIDSSVPGGGVASFNGTSMAAPHVAGAWAVLKQQQPDASVTEILSILQQTGVSVNDDRPFGAVTELRRIHLGQAINAAPPQTNVYLPIIFGSGASPDLVVDCICGDALNPHIMPHGSGNCPAPTSAIEVTIRNQGAAPVTTSFWVDIYLNPVPAPTGVNQIWDDGRAPYGLAWGVPEAALPLEPGETLTLTTRPDDPYLVRSRSLLPFTSLTNATIYAQVDSVNLNTTYGGVREAHEVNGGAYNNILGGVTTVTLTATTLDPAPKQTEPSGNLPSRS